MSDTITLEFYPDAFQFSIAHFTIFSATHRERWHGHNYSVAAAVSTVLQAPGFSFDYAIFKKKLLALCAQLDNYFVLPAQSPYLQIVDRDNYYEAQFCTDTMRFLKKDVLLLPIANTTLEDLAYWFLKQLIKDHMFIKKYQLTAIRIKVFNSNTQSASVDWQTSYNH